MTWTQVNSSKAKRTRTRSGTPPVESGDPARHCDAVIEERLEQRLEALTMELASIRELLEEKRSSEESAQEDLGPIIPLNVAAEKLFQKSPEVVMSWVKKGHLSAIAMPDGKRGCSYYFNLSQLLEELEENFTYQ